MPFFLHARIKYVCTNVHFWKTFFCSGYKYGHFELLAILDADAVQTQLKFRLSRYRTVFKQGPSPILFTHSLKLKSDMNLLSIIFFSQVLATKLDEFLPIVGEQILSEGSVLLSYKKCGE